MEISASKIGFAAGLATGVIWIICSIIVYLAPSAMTEMTGHMIHMDVSAINLTISIKGVLFGLIGWVVLIGAFAWFITLIYNRFSSR
jgi:uncharacterized protein HemY